MGKTKIEDYFEHPRHKSDSKMSLGRFVTTIKGWALATGTEIEFFTSTKPDHTNVIVTNKSNRSPIASYYSESEYKLPNIEKKEYLEFVKDGTDNVKNKGDAVIVSSGYTLAGYWISEKEYLIRGGYYGKADINVNIY